GDATTARSRCRYDGAVARLLSRVSRALRPEAVARREAEALDEVFGPSGTARTAPLHRRSRLRVAVGVIGLAVVVYGATTLTGGWLGEPPWWRDWSRFYPAEGARITESAQLYNGDGRLEPLRRDAKGEWEVQYLVSARLLRRRRDRRPRPRGVRRVVEEASG